MKVVSERLGHAQIAHTMQTYQHVLPGMQAAAADTTERLANPRPGTTTPPKRTPTRKTTPKKTSPDKATAKEGTPKKAAAKKATKPARKTPVERRGNNRRKAA